MPPIANKRSVMTLYSSSLDMYSHQARIVLAEKSVSVDVIYVDQQQEKHEDLLDLNPYNTVPTLIDRDLVLYESRIIMEYLDERFPHPPLLPVYPVMRAKLRLMMYRIDRDWYKLVQDIETGDAQTQQIARKELQEELTSVSPILEENPYFLSEDFSLVDCVLAPLLWRLPSLGISLPKQAKAMERYAKRLFDRDAFQASLTDLELELTREVG